MKNYNLNINFLNRSLIRQAAIIKFWNPEIVIKKFTKLFFWNHFWKIFRKPKLYFQKKSIFKEQDSKKMFLMYVTDLTFY